MTQLQMFIISNISSMFSDVERLKKICDEYSEIFGTNLKDDWEDYCELGRRIFNPK